MTLLWDMPFRQVLSPAGLPRSQSFRPRLTLTAANHPALMRFLESVDSACLGDVFAALAEEAVRARLGFIGGMVTPPINLTPEVIQKFPGGPSSTPKEASEVSTAHLDQSTGVMAGLGKYDRAALDQMFDVIDE